MMENFIATFYILKVQAHYSDPTQDVKINWQREVPIRNPNA